MALKTTTAFRFIGRLFTYFKSLYNPCSSKLKGGKITLSFLIFLIKKVKQNMWYPLIQLRLFSSIFFDSPINEYCFQILNKKSNIKRLAQGTLYKINYHNANKATASTRSDDSEQDKFRTVLSKRCSGAKGSKYVKAASQKFLGKKMAKIILKRIFFLKLSVPGCPWGWTSPIWPWCGHPLLGKSTWNLRKLQPLRALSEAVRQLHKGRAFYGLNRRALIPANVPEIALETQRSPSAVATSPASSYFKCK